jgi:hypothetical protein
MRALCCFGTAMICSFVILFRDFCPLHRFVRIRATERHKDVFMSLTAEIPSDSLVPSWFSGPVLRVPELRGNSVRREARPKLPPQL